MKWGQHIFGKDTPSRFARRIAINSAAGIAGGAVGARVGERVGPRVGIGRETGRSLGAHVGYHGAQILSNKALDKIYEIQDNPAKFKGEIAAKKALVKAKAKKVKDIVTRRNNED